MWIPRHGIIQSSKLTVVPFLLDSYSGSAVAYSLRKLSSTYSGSAIRVRRSSDNTEQDIGFDSNYNLDETSLLSFVGSGSGFVSIWYDQSGNARNASQSTQANQPRIVNSGVIEKKNSRCTLFFDGSNDTLATSNFTQNDGYFSAYGVSNHTTTTLGTVLNGDINSGTRMPQYIRNTAVSGVPQVVAFVGGAATLEAGISTAQNSTVLLSSHKFSNSLEIFSNGSSNGATTQTGASNSASAPIYIGVGPNSTGYMTGYISETILYGTNQVSNRSGVETNIKSYYSIS